MQPNKSRLHPNEEELCFSPRTPVRNTAPRWLLGLGRGAAPQGPVFNNSNNNDRGSAPQAPVFGNSEPSQASHNSADASAGPSGTTPPSSHRERTNDTNVPSFGLNASNFTSNSEEMRQKTVSSERIPLERLPSGSPASSNAREPAPEPPSDTPQSTPS